MAVLFRAASALLIFAPAPVRADEEPAKSACEDVARQQRAQFARQYLDKLINIEVPVPRLTAEQTLKLLARKRAEAEAMPAAALRWRPWAVLAGHLLPFAVAAVVVMAGIVLGPTRREVR